MSKDNLEQFMSRVASSEDQQAKVGEEMTGDALVAEHGCEFWAEDFRARAELSDEESERVAGGGGVAINRFGSTPAGSLLLGAEDSSSGMIVARLRLASISPVAVKVRIGALPSSGPMIP